MKRFLFVLGVMPFILLAEDVYKTVVDGTTFYYSLNSYYNGAGKSLCAIVQTGSDKYAGELNIPDSLDGYPVANVYITDCPALTKVVLPDGMVEFFGVRECPLVTNIVVPNTVKTISSQAFYGDRGLKRVCLPTGITKIESSTFGYCEKLEEIVVPEGVKEIDYGAFAGCVSLRKVVLPDSLEKLGDYPFQGCVSLGEIFIPKNVTSIEHSLLFGCTSITNISLAADNALFKVVDGSLVSSSGLTLLAVEGARGEIRVPAGVVAVENGIFQYNDKIKGVSLPESIVSVGNYAFEGCWSLTNILFEGDAPLFVGNYAFLGTSYNLTFYAYFDRDGWPVDGNWQEHPLVLLDREASLRHAVTFDADGGLPQPDERVSREGDSIGVLPAVEKYGHEFVGWFAEAEGGVPYAAESIMPAHDLHLTARWEKKRYTVVFVSGLGLPVEQITRKYLDVIGDMPTPAAEGRDFLGWFTDEESGERMSGDAQVKADMTLYAHWAFETIKEGRTWRFVVEGDRVKILPSAVGSGPLVVPSELDGHPVREIPDACFANCSNLISVTLPASVTNIGAYAFYNCVNLKGVVFNEGLVSIGDGAFAKCESIEKVTLPSTVRSIGSRLAMLNPVAEVSEKSEAHYSFETSYVDVARCVREIRSSQETKACSSCNTGQGVFECCLSLEDVNLNDGLQSIGAGVFKNCKALGDLAIPESVSSIGGLAETLAKSTRESSSNVYDLLQEEGGQPSILTSERIVSDESSSFAHADSGFLEGCSALCSVQLPRCLKYLGPNSFAGCSKLTSVELPDSLTVINRGTFSRCNKLSTIRFPANLELIGGDELPCSVCESSAFDALRENGSDWSVLTSQRTRETANGHWIDSLSENGSKPSVLEGDEEDRRWLPDPQDVRFAVDDGAFWDWFYRWRGAEVVITAGCSLSDDLLNNLRREFASVRPTGPSFESSGAGVFYGCSSLREVCLPQSVRRIADYSFYDCCNLVKIELPVELGILGYQVFGGETALMDVATPWFNFSSLWEIFPSHSYVTNLVILSSPPDIMDPNDVVRSVMNEMRGERLTIEELMARGGGITASENQEIARKCMEDLWITQDDEVLYGFRNLKSLTLPEGLRSFDWTIGWWSPQKLLDVTLPNTLVGLGWRAFAGFPAEHITLPSSLQTIADEVFLESNVGDVLFMGNAPCDVSPNVFVETSGWDPDYVAREDLVVRVYPGSHGWDGNFESASLPTDGLWPAHAAVYKRRPVQFVRQPVSAVLGGEGGADALTYFDAMVNRLVTVPQTWLNSYGLLSIDTAGAVGVANLSPIASRSLYDSYVAGLDPTDEESQFKLKIEIVDNKPIITWEPVLPSEESAKRKYTIYGCKELGGEWYNADEAPDEVKSQLRFFKVGVEMR